MIRTGIRAAFQIACLLLLATLVALGQSRNATIFSDNFNSGRISSRDWTYSGSSVTTEGGVMKVATAVTDRGGSLESQWIDVPAQGTLIISRRTKVQYGNEYFAGVFSVAFESAPQLSFGVSYSNYKYDQDGYCSRFGFFFFRKGAIPHECKAPEDVIKIDPIWNEWFDEKIVFYFRDRVAEYSINGTPVATFSINVPLTEQTKVKLKFNAWGWYTGHTQSFDNLVLTRGDGSSAATVAQNAPATASSSSRAVNIEAYCRTQHGSDAFPVNVDGQAYSWRCMVRGSTGNSYFQINMDEACRLQHGSGLKAVTNNASDANSWRCAANDEEAAGQKGSAPNSQTRRATPAAESGSNISQARNEASKAWDQYFTKCGDSYYTRVRSTGLLSRGEYIGEYRPVSITIKESQLTEADKLNGIVWKGHTYFNAPAERAYRGGWSAWNSEGIHLNIYLWKQSGTWNIGEVSYVGFKVTDMFGKISCSDVPK